MGIMLKDKDKGTPPPPCLEGGGEAVPLLETCYQVFGPITKDPREGKIPIFDFEVEEGSTRDKQVSGWVERRVR